MQAYAQTHTHTRTNTQMYTRVHWHICTLTWKHRRIFQWKQSFNTANIYHIFKVKLHRNLHNCVQKKKTWFFWTFLFYHMKLDRFRATKWGVISLVTVNMTSSVPTDLVYYTTQTKIVQIHTIEENNAGFSHKSRITFLAKLFSMPSFHHWEFEAEILNCRTV